MKRTKGNARTGAPEAESPPASPTIGNGGPTEEFEVQRLIKEAHANGGESIPLPIYLRHPLPEDATEEDAAERKRLLVAAARAAGLMVQTGRGDQHTSLTNCSPQQIDTPQPLSQAITSPTLEATSQADHAENHNQSAAVDGIKAIHRQDGQELSVQDVVEFISKPINLGRPSQEPRKRGRPSKRTQLEDLYYQAYLRRRGHFHKKIRLKNNRHKAATVRKRAGDPSREIVFKLAAEVLLRSGKVRPQPRKIKAIAAARGLTIPSDSQLGKLINEFMKVDTTE
ncbi:MAG TPA: hypothetical protein VGK09_10720 [Rhodocyclaceae bacterium]|jgi:hypothetical protein